MIYNSDRQHVRDYRDGDPSTCPECGGKLIAKRGDRIRWHFAHHRRPAGDGPGGCGIESAWHLDMKAAHVGRPGWTVEEQALENGRVIFRVDAVHRPGLQIREFVHSLSPTYRPKHERLGQHKANVLWLFDGEHFASERLSNRLDKNGRPFIRKLLKAAARDYCEQLGGFVHYRGRIWRQWKSDNYFPATPRDHPQMTDLLEVLASRLAPELVAEQDRMDRERERRRAEHERLVADMDQWTKSAN